VIESVLNNIDSLTASELQRVEKAIHKRFGFILHRKMNEVTAFFPPPLWDMTFWEPAAARSASVVYTQNAPQSWVYSFEVHAIIFADKSTRKFRIYPHAPQRSIGSHLVSCRTPAQTLDFIRLWPHIVSSMERSMGSLGYRIYADPAKVSKWACYTGNDENLALTVCRHQGGWSIETAPPSNNLRRCFSGHWTVSSDEFALYPRGVQVKRMVSIHPDGSVTDEMSRPGAAPWLEVMLGTTCLIYTNLTTIHPGSASYSVVVGKEDASTCLTNITLPFTQGLVQKIKKAARQFLKEAT